MKRIAILAFFLLSTLSPCAAQRIKRMEFRNQPIPDILLALAESAGVSIIPDETVGGSASFFFAESGFEEALGRFLASYKLFVVRDGTTYYVSRVRASFDSSTGLADLAADDVDVSLLVRALSRAIGKTVLYDPLPRATITINARSLPPEAILALLARKFPDYRVESDDACFYLRKLAAEGSASGKSSKPAVRREGQVYDLALDKGRFLETLVELFKAADKEYSLLTKSDMALENLYFSGRDFDSLLRLVLEQGSADYSIRDGIYYIFEIQRRDVLKKLRDSEVLPLRSLPVQELVSLLPAELSAGSLLRIDKTTNSVILTGSAEEIAPLRSFILALDRPTEGMAYHRYNLKYLKVRDLVALLPPKLLPIAPIVLPEGNSFAALLPDEASDDLGEFIALVDRKTEGFPVFLRYLRNEEFFKNLPPSVAKDELVDSCLPGLVFFTGSEDKRRLLLRELGLMDRPKPQVRYELLVVQYQRSRGVEWSKKITVGSVVSPDAAVFSGELSSLLSLNFDAVSLFGYQAALDLSLTLSESRAQVFADTTLTGVSGQEIRFQNTDTFRYRELEYDKDTGKNEYTGVTSEVTSGLILSVNGWVSGDGMVTMTVSATISKEAEDESKDSDNPPPTTEKVVTTTVRTISGKPVVIGGLFQRSKDVSVKKIPVLGDIPLVGRIFRDIDQSEEDTEMVIYIVPHVVSGDESDAQAVGRRMEGFYASFVEGYVR